MTICSVRLAQAQDFDPGNGQDASASAPTAAEPAKKAPPENFGGCWDGSSIDGSLQDQVYGPGHGWIGIDQKGSKIKGGRNGSYFEFLFDDLAFAYGPFASGKATSTGFTFSGKGSGACRIKVIGAFGPSSNIVGTYKAVHCNTKKATFDAVGTFDFPLDSSGCKFVNPPQ
ncbi:MAG: hypothetical protein ACREQR_18455 [Candidatus Binataceae bacterium]